MSGCAHLFRREKSLALQLLTRIRPPSPILGHYGHRHVKKCLAKSAERGVFSTDHRDLEPNVSAIGRAGPSNPRRFNYSRTESVPVKCSAPARNAFADYCKRVTL